MVKKKCTYVGFWRRFEPYNVNVLSTRHHFRERVREYLFVAIQSMEG